MSFPILFTYKYEEMILRRYKETVKEPLTGAELKKLCTEIFNSVYDDDLEGLEVHQFLYIDNDFEQKLEIRDKSFYSEKVSVHLMLKKNYETTKSTYFS